MAGVIFPLGLGARVFLLSWKSAADFVAPGDLASATRPTVVLVRLPPPRRQAQTLSARINLA